MARQRTSRKTVKPSGASGTTAITIQQIPPKARAIISVGDKTTAAAIELFARDTPLLFGDDDDGLDLEPLAHAFKAAKWSDEEAAKVVALFAQTKEKELL